MKDFKFFGFFLVISELTLSVWSSCTGSSKPNLPSVNFPTSLQAHKKGFVTQLCLLPTFGSRSHFSRRLWGTAWIRRAPWWLKHQALFPAWPAGRWCAAHVLWTHGPSLLGGCGVLGSSFLFHFPAMRQMGCLSCAPPHTHCCQLNTDQKQGDSQPRAATSITRSQKCFFQEFVTGQKAEQQGSRSKNQWPQGDNQWMQRLLGACFWESATEERERWGKSRKESRRKRAKL